MHFDVMGLQSYRFGEIMQTRYTVQGQNSGPRKFGSQETRRNYLSQGVDILTDDYVVLSQRTRLTDRRTDRQTDRCRQQERL